MWRNTRKQFIPRFLHETVFFFQPQREGKKPNVSLTAFVLASHISSSGHYKHINRFIHAWTLWMRDEIREEREKKHCKYIWFFFVSAPLIKYNSSHLGTHAWICVYSFNAEEKRNRKKHTPIEFECRHNHTIKICIHTNNKNIKTWNDSKNGPSTRPPPTLRITSKIKYI